MARRSSATPAAVADALHSAALHLLRRVREEDEAAGLGPARLSALSVVVFGGPRRLTDLARAEQVRPPTMTKVVAALARQGLVRRRADPADARVSLVEATPRGRRLMLDGRQRRVDRLAAGLASLSAGERATLASAAALMARLARVI